MITEYSLLGRQKRTLFPPSPSFYLNCILSWILGGGFIVDAFSRILGYYGPTAHTDSVDLDLARILLTKMGAYGVLCTITPSKVE